MSFLIIALICTIISGYLFKKASGTISLHSPNMMSVIFYLYFVVNNVIGAVLIVNQVDNHYAINKLSNSIYRYYGFWTIMYTIIVFPIGQLIANSLFVRKKMCYVYSGYIKKNIINESSGIRNHVKYTLLILSFICLIAVVYTLIMIGGSPLGALFSGTDTMDLAMMRSDANRNFGGNEYFRNIFGLTLTPFLSYVAYGYKLLNNSRFNKLWFWSMLIASILILTYDLEKAPLLLYLLGFVFFKVYMGYSLSNKMLITLFVIVLSIIVAMYSLLTSYGLDGMFVFNQGVVGRLTLSSNAGVFLSYDIFPSNHDFLGFSSFSGVLSDLLDIPHSERSARYVMEYVNPSGIASGLAGVYNSLFVAEAWANWGVVGVLLSPIHVGFVIQCLYLFLLKSRKTPFFLGLMVFYTIRSSINGGVNDYIYSTMFIVMLFIYYLVFFFGIKHSYNRFYEKNNHSLPI